MCVMLTVKTVKTATSTAEVQDISRYKSFQQTARFWLSLQETTSKKTRVVRHYMNRHSQELMAHDSHGFDPKSDTVVSLYIYIYIYDICLW